MRAGERAPQLTATNGRDERSLASWIARAKSSLPVPVSARRSTGKLVDAKRAARCFASTRPGSWPRIAANADDAGGAGDVALEGCGGETGARSTCSAVKCTRTASVRSPAPAIGSTAMRHVPSRVSKRIPPRCAAAATSSANEIPSARSHVRVWPSSSVRAARAARLTTRTTPVASTRSSGPDVRWTSRSIAANAPLRRSPYAIARSARSTARPAVCTLAPIDGSWLSRGPDTSSTATSSP